MLLFLRLGVTVSEAEIPSRTIHFTVFSDLPIEGLVFFPNEKAPPLSLIFYPTARSVTYEYYGAGPMTFYQSDGVSKPSEIVAETELPPGSDRWLLLFSRLEPHPSSSRRYRVYAFDDRAVRRGPKTLSILNMSGLILGGRVGERSITLVEGLNPILPLDPSTQIEFRTSYHGRSYPAFVETVEMKPTERALLILFPPFRTGSLEVQSRWLVDELSPAVEKPKQR